MADSRIRGLAATARTIPSRAFRRGPLARGDVASPPATPTIITMVNQAPNPRFRLTGGTAQDPATGERYPAFDLPVDSGGVACDPGTRAFVVPDSVGGMCVVGTSHRVSTTVYPGGALAVGEFRLGIRPDVTYTLTAGLFLSEPLLAPLAIDHLTIAVLARIADGALVTLARSLPAPNRAGAHQVSVTAHVPAGATATCVQLLCGMAADRGRVWWTELLVTATISRVSYFDGDSAPTAGHTFAWTGDPHRSTSTRTMRPPPETLGIGAHEAAALPEQQRGALRERVTRLVDERARGGLIAEAKELTTYCRQAFGPKDWATQACRGALLLGEGDTDAALARYASARALPSVSALPALRAGEAYEDRREWERARRCYAEAVAAEPDVAEYRYRNADMLWRTRRFDETRPEALAGVAVDRPLPFDHERALETWTRWFRARREVGLFVAANLAEIQVRARAYTPPLSELPQREPIFCYWGQGLDAAPAVARGCITRLRRLNEGVHFLTDADLQAWVDLPARPAAATAGHRAAYSDILRLELLRRYGGIWVDATCYLGTQEPLREVVRPLVKDGFFAFNRGKPQMSNWFLAAKPDSLLLNYTAEALIMWWERNDHLAGYYLFHHLFEMLYWLDEDFRVAWDAVPDRDSRDAHTIRAGLLEPSTPEAARLALQESFVHKLSYKGRRGTFRADSLMGHLMREDH